MKYRESRVRETSLFKQVNQSWKNTAVAIDSQNKKIIGARKKTQLQAIRIQNMNPVRGPLHNTINYSVYPNPQNMARYPNTHNYTNYNQNINTQSQNHFNRQKSKQMQIPPRNRQLINPYRH